MFELELASRGGRPLFRPFHILKAIWHIQQHELMGRKELSTELAIGEGSARKLIVYLEEKGWASSSRQGIMLTDLGNQLLKDIGLRAATVKDSDLTVAGHNFGIRLAGLAEFVGTGIEQRDEAMKVGASGASTLIFQGGLKFSDGYDAASVDELASNHLVKEFGLGDDDVLIIGSSMDLAMAMDGAFAAAVLTLKDQ